MKKEDIPQDLSSLGKITNEVCYVTDPNGNYVTALSKGWEVKITANDTAWKDIEDRVNSAKQKVLNKQASPILFFMEKRLMDLSILSAYTGFWKWQIRQHMKPSIFNKLSNKKLHKYSNAFNVSVDDIINMRTNED